MNIELTPKNAETLAKCAALAAHAQKKAISSQFVMKLLLFLTFTMCAVKGMAQMPNPYGPSVNLENAKKAAAPALAEARKNNWTMAVAIVDNGGHFGFFWRIDKTSIGGGAQSHEKEAAAAFFLH